MNYYEDDVLYEDTAEDLLLDKRFQDEYTARDRIAERVRELLKEELPLIEDLSDIIDDPDEFFRLVVGGER
jgi:hypothetical protein